MIGSITTQEIWNNIVDLYNTHKNAEESALQFLWCDIFAEYFGYSRLNNEIDSHRTIQIGSYERAIPDIILKNKEQDLFVVELKKHNFTFSINMQQQLFSYLKQTRITTGVLICDKIYIYDFDYHTADDQQKKAVIDFYKDNEDGNKFVEMFLKTTFSKESVVAFIREKIALQNDIQKIKQSLSRELIFDLLKQHFYATYPQNIVDNTLANYNIAIIKLSPPNPTPFPPPNPTPFPSPDPTFKYTAIDFCRKNGFRDMESFNTTYATLGQTSVDYPANVSPNHLTKDWYIVLNDTKHRRYYVLKVPPNSLRKEQFKKRPDNGKLIIYIKYNDYSFTDHRSGIPFKPYFVKYLEY